MGNAVIAAPGESTTPESRLHQTERPDLRVPNQKQFAVFVASHHTHTAIHPVAAVRGDDWECACRRRRRAV